MGHENLSADDAVNGFTRPEMDTENLGGTVDAYDRHVFLYYKNRVSWPPRVEFSDADPLPKLFAATWKARKSDMTLKTKITVCEAREDAGFSDGDVLIFPEMIKYRGQMGPSVAEVRGAEDQKLANGEDTNKGKNDHVGSRFDIERIRENIDRWILMANGIPCCSPPQKCNFHLREMGPSVAEVKGADDQKLVNDEGANKGTEKSKICKNRPVLKERHILTAVVVLGVVATVTVAYKLHRR